MLATGCAGSIEGRSELCPIINTNAHTKGGSRRGSLGGAHILVRGGGGGHR